jgi:hypothetical protein
VPAIAWAHLASVLRGSHARISPGASRRPKLFSGAQLGFNPSRKLRAGKKPCAAVAAESDVAFDPHIAEARFAEEAKASGPKPNRYLLATTCSRCASVRRPPAGRGRRAVRPIGSGVNAATGGCARR